MFNAFDLNSCFFLSIHFTVAPLAKPFPWSWNFRSKLMLCSAHIFKLNHISLWSISKYFKSPFQCHALCEKEQNYHSIRMHSLISQKSDKIKVIWLEKWINKFHARKWNSNNSSSVPFNTLKPVYFGCGTININGSISHARVILPNTVIYSIICIT